MTETKPTNPKDLIGITKQPILSAVSTASILYEARAMADGVEKYGAFNYREKGVRIGVYVDACLRHVFAYFDGEEVAADSKAHHLGHAKACLGIIIDGIEQGNLVDDRPISGKSPELLERLRLERVAKKATRDDDGVTLHAQPIEGHTDFCPACAKGGTFDHAEPVEIRSDDLYGAVKRY